MSVRLAVVIALLVVVPPLACAADTPTLSLQQFFVDAARQPNGLARYRYVLVSIPSLPRSSWPIAQQFMAFAENELGLYGEAIRDFPLRSRLPEKLALPQPPEWQPVDAADALSGLATERRIVMINEAHHDAHTRLMTLTLLPRLRKLGFTHLAIEALDERDTALNRRGYPVAASGSEYLHEPVYGEIVREALRLGYVVVPYDPAGGNGQDRENRQAERLYEEVLARQPQAKLLVHAGYAHIDKAPGRLGTVHPMAMRLHELTGTEILSIDQTDIREEDPSNEAEAYLEVLSAQRDGKPQAGIQAPPIVDRHAPRRLPYEELVKTFRPTAPVVLRHTGDGVLWSARPGIYDVSVILPPANGFVSDYVLHGVLSLTFHDKRYLVLPPAADGHRPNWLALGGRRRTVAIDSSGCARTFPCLVEALYANESDDAVAADRYVFLEDNQRNQLFLQPGNYRLRITDADGKSLTQSSLTVPAGDVPPATGP